MESEKAVTLINPHDASDDGKILSLVSVARKLNTADLDRLTAEAQKMVDDSEAGPSCCPYCGGDAFIRYGKKHGRQRYLCRSEVCGHTFVSTRNTVMYMSHQQKSVWREVIRDTLEGLSLEHTRKRLGEMGISLSHKTIFFMRHKILLALEAQQDRDMARESQPGEQNGIGGSRSGERNGRGGVCPQG